MKHTFVFMLAAITGLLGYRFIDSTIDQHSGPFAYFKDLPGEGTVLQRGQGQVDLWLKVGNDGAVAIENGRRAGFKCRSLEKDPLADLRPDTKSGGCTYVFGFFGENWYFGVVTDDKGTIFRSYQDIAPPLDL